MKSLVVLLLLVTQVLSKWGLEVLYHNDFYLGSKYFYNDVLFQFNKEYDYYSNSKMTVYVTDSLLVFSK